MGIKGRIKKAFRGKKAPVPQPVTIVSGNFLENKNVLISGAGRNIGSAIAVEMAAQGAGVFFTDVDPEALKHTEAALRDFPVRMKGYLSDIANESDNDRLCKDLASEGILIDVLVNNVGHNPGTEDIFDVTVWRRTFDLNLFGPCSLTHRIAETLKEQKRPGSIIFVSSIHQWSVNGSPAYSASKGAIGMVIKELAVKFAPFDIRVNGIAPAWVRNSSEEGSYKYAPLHRRGIEPCYIGRAAVFLASEYFSRYTTGTVMTVDAGTLLYNHRVDQLG